MNTLKAPSLQSLLESDRGSNDSLLAESLQLDFDEVNREGVIFWFFLYFGTLETLILGEFWNESVVLIRK